MVSPRPESSHRPLQRVPLGIVAEYALHLRADAQCPNRPSHIGVHVAPVRPRLDDTE